MSSTRTTRRSTTSNPSWPAARADRWPEPAEPAGQALYLARIKVMSTYKDLTDALPSRIGRPNKFGVPPAYFDADIEPLIEEYARALQHHAGAAANAQTSETPFKDVADLGTAIARAKGLDAATADAAGRISLGIFFAETNGNQNIGNARSNNYKGSLQTGTAEDRNGRSKWAAIKPKIARARSRGGRARRQGGGARRQGRPALQSLDRGAQRPDERARRSVRADPGDHEDAARRDRSDEALRAHPDHPQPDARRRSSRATSTSYRISDPKIMGYLRNNSMFTFGKTDRAKNSATFPRNPRRDVAVQRQVRAGARQVRRDQGAAETMTIRAAPREFGSSAMSLAEAMAAAAVHSLP